MELLDLYKPEFTPAHQTIVRSTPAPEGTCILIVFVCIFDSSGRLLIQRRALQKSFGGLWDVSAGGHVQSGESSAEAAVREVREELGISLSPDHLTRLMSIYYDGSIHDIYTCTGDYALSDLTLQTSEVMDARWVTLQELDAMLDDGSFLKVRKEFLHLLFAMKTEKGIM